MGLLKLSEQHFRDEVAGHRRYGWLLVRVAAQNVGRRRLRAVSLGLAVMLGVGISFASFVAGWALREGIATSFARMGADLVVVPRGALVNITSSLLTVQPTGETLDATLRTPLSATTGVARVAPQRIAPAVIDGRVGNLIAFDPAHDFSVLPWLEDRQPGPLTAGGVIAGARVAGRLGESLNVCGLPLSVQGRLARTGVGPFDESYFLSFDTLDAVVAVCRTPGTQAGRPTAQPERQANGQAHPVGDPGAGHADIEPCAADLPLGRVSAFLLQLSPGAKLGDVRFAVAQIPDVKIVEGNAVLTASRQALNFFLVGIAAFAAFQITALLAVVSLLFSAIVQERHHELGLLRALGARPGQVMTVILSEAAIVTGLGGLAGLVLGATLLLTFARSLGFYFGLLGVPFSWPSVEVLAAGVVAAVAASVLLGLVGALLPAWRVRRMAPYALIQAGGR